MKTLARWRGLVDRVFFGSRNSRASEAVAYISANVFLMGGVFYLFLNSLVYDWTGSLYAGGFHLATPLDLAIPFRPEWGIVYLYVFFWVAEATMVLFGVVFYKRGYGLAWSLVLINLVADLVYAVFPVTTDAYRTELLAHPMSGNGWAQAMYAYFGKDPSYDCFPSLHAAVSVIVFYAWYRFWRSRPNAGTAAAAILSGLVSVATMLSTLFVKQHYIVDEIAGLTLALVIGKLVFDRFESA